MASYTAGVIMAAVEHPSTAEQPSPVAVHCSGGWASLRLGLRFYLLTTAIVVLGVCLGRGYLATPSREGFIRSFLRWDSGWYEHIMTQGYSYTPGKQSPVAFFPGYPCGAWCLHRLTDLPPDWSLVVLANLCLAATFVLLAAYVRRRYGDAPDQMVLLTLLALGLLPTTFWFRMAYSESPFVMLTVLSLYLMERRAPLPLIAATMGLATGIRPTGIALLAPLAWHLWQRMPGVRAAVWGAVLLPLSCWGLLAYMLYQGLAFDAPLAFAQAQDSWRLRPGVPWEDKIFDLLTLEPLWSVYDPASPCYAGKSPQAAIFNLYFANPIYFVLTAGLVGLGAWKGWLSMAEVMLSAALLLIPYLTHAHEACMQSQGRYAAVVFPVYLVLACLLRRVPESVCAGLAAVSGVLLGLYAALFTASYPFM
jgi:hypothetical protein